MCHTVSRDDGTTCTGPAGATRPRPPPCRRPPAASSSSRSAPRPRRRRRRCADVRLPDPGLDERLLAGLRGLVGDAHVRVDHEARVRHTRGRSTPDLLRMRHGDGSDAPDAVVLPADHDEVVAVVGLVRGAPGRAGPLRRRYVGGRRARRPARRLRRRAGARPAPARPARRGRPGLPHRHPRGRRARPAGRGAARRARPHPRPLPAVLRVRLHRRLRRHPLQRPGLLRLRPLRPDGGRAAGGHPARRAGAGHARPPPPPVPTCASSCSAPRAPSA